MRALRFVVAAVIAGGCGEKPEETTGASQGSSSGGSTEGVSAGTTTGATGTTAEPTGSGSTGQGGTSTTGATGSTGTTSGATTGGAGCAMCGADEWCDWATNDCGSDPDGVTCQTKPQGCDLIFAPVCGCDGTTYGNACDAASAGVDVAEAGGCAPPEGYFACGFVFCEAGTQYCNVQLSDIGGFPNSYQCKGLPNGCAPPSCDCLKDELCGELCEAVEGGLKVTCPGG